MWPQPYGQPAYPPHQGGYPPAPGGYGAYPPYGAPPPEAQHTPSSAPRGAYPDGYAQKKAVLVGCSYPGTSSQLNGCINDIQCMKYLLTNKYHFQESDILVLRDDVHHPDFFPTRSNIMRALQWLVTGQQPSTSLFFHYSGHGGSQRAQVQGDEADGMDETSCPNDYQTAGQITDNELNAMLVRPLMPGVMLHCVIDACHSGTALDLPFSSRSQRGSALYWEGYPRPDKQTQGGTCIQFGACTDQQTAADTNAMSGSAYTGAATFSFIQAVERGGAKQTYGQLLAAMTHSLDNRASSAPAGGGGFAMPGNLMAGLPGGLGGMMGMLGGGGGGGALGGLVGMLGAGLGGGMGGGGGGGGGVGQTPILSCDKQIDMNSTYIML